MYKPKGLYLLAIAVLVAMLVPVISLIVGITSFREIGAPTFSFLSFIRSSYALGLTENSLEFSIAHAALGVTLATFYAWVVARSDIPWKRFFELLPLLGLTQPLEVKVFAWIFLADPHVGMLNILLKSLLGSSAPLLDIYGMGGMIWVAMIGAVPLAYLIIMPAMKSMDPSLEEASRIAGRGTFSTFYSITVRVLWPAILVAFLLSTLSGLAIFDYPYFLGQPAGVHTLSTEVYYWAEGASPPSYGNAGVISILFVMITAITVSLYIWATRKTNKYITVTGRSERHVFYKLRRWKPLAIFACSLIVFFEFFLPFIALLLESFSNISITHSFQNINIDFPSAYIKAIHIPGFFPSLKATFEFGIATAALLTIISALLSFATLKVKTRAARLTEFVTSIPLAIPGIVFGVALTWMFLIVPGLSRFYGSLVPLVFALVVIRLPYTTRIISANLFQISNELEEASQVAGSKFRKTFTRITLPLIKGGLINSFVYALVDSMRELGAVVLLSSSTAMPFTSLLLNYYEVHNVTGNVLAAGSVILTGLIIIILVALAIVERLTGRRKYKEISGVQESTPLPKGNRN